LVLHGTGVIVSQLLDTTPTGGSLFNLMQTIGALRIEVNTGMRHSRGSVLKHSQRVYGVTARTKVVALAQLEELYRDFTGREYGTP
jgi:hypothetical protein